MLENQKGMDEDVKKKMFESLRSEGDMKRKKKTKDQRTFKLGRREWLQLCMLIFW